MPHFKIRCVDLPLFGLVEENDKKDFYEAFSARSPEIEIEISHDEFNLISNELEYDAHGVVESAKRYTAGEFAYKARGMDGNELGNFGEVLTYLAYRGKGCRIVRVFSYSTAGQPLKGARFPRPDFLVGRDGQQFALEVKSTQAFDVQALRPMNKFRWLHACRGVKKCRAEALPQLGYIENEFRVPSHELKRSDAVMVPFPAREGIAAAILAQDGRTQEFRKDSRYYSSAACRSADPPRSCWTCFAPGTAAVLVGMKNLPGSLRLPGGAGDRWLDLYERWTSALRAHEPGAILDTSTILADATTEWLAGGAVPDARENLRAFWGSYFSNAHAIHGLERAPTGGLTTLRALDENWKRRPIQTPIEILDSETMRARIAGAADSDIDLRLALRPSKQARPEWSLAAMRQRGSWRFTLLPSEWWTERGATEDSAPQIARILLNKILDLSGWAPLEGSDPPPLRPLSAAVGEKTITFGWTLVPAFATGRRDAMDFWNSKWGPWWFPPFIGGPLWLQALALGDRRALLHVHIDGRAELQLSGEAATAISKPRPRGKA